MKIVGFIWTVESDFNQAPSPNLFGWAWRPAVEYCILTGSYPNYHPMSLLHILTCNLPVTSLTVEFKIKLCKVYDAKVKSDVFCMYNVNSPGSQLTS